MTSGFSPRSLPWACRGETNEKQENKLLCDERLYNEGLSCRKVRPDGRAYLSIKHPRRIWRYSYFTFYLRWLSTEPSSGRAIHLPKAVAAVGAVCEMSAEAPWNKGWNLYVTEWVCLATLSSESLLLSDVLGSPCQSILGCN